MNAITLLVSQHDEVDALIEKLEKADDGRTKRAIFSTLADNLAAHIAIEEVLFYPAVVAKQTEDQLHEAVEEHLSVKRIIVDMLTLPAGDAQFDAKLSVMKEALEHHNRKEEEGELFPKVRKLMTAEELFALGSEMLAMFTTLVAAAPREDLANETDQAATVPSA